MFYLVTLAEEQNQKFWLHADKHLSGDLDWRLVATSKFAEVIGRFHDFIFDHSFRWNEDPHRDLATIICCLWELNPSASLDELRVTCDDIRARTGCRCLVVPDELIQYSLHHSKPDDWVEIPYSFEPKLDELLACESAYMSRGDSGSSP